MCTEIAKRRSRSAALTLKPARKTRTKTRKPKFLSLRLQFSPETGPPSCRMTTAITADHRHQQLNLFPLHPEHQLVYDKDTQDENVAYFFDSADGGATTLTTLLGPGSSTEEEENVRSPSLTYPCGGKDSDDVALVRTAMRSKERDASEDKWVSYSEVTSCTADPRHKEPSPGTQQGLSLKLDYREIMNAWSDKGPLYIPPECPQTVPDLLDDLFAGDPYSNWKKDCWAVPERSSLSSSGDVPVRVKEEAGEEGKAAGKREARVQRYKEKRQSRLFSKRIRYEVRKINAENRPRIKGRFVKRC
ncbi:zinc finger protein CONSTANS-LIKE 7 [Diospyros lotus]|uniref:zinc finger protein CONSTANS-LIKE 7 n=1 Tax=Diospyros lotus TaxID=55363 RepID=UPI00225BDD43|nr:zinc finger protein CONSTANS-LIKE 7 [Diospyros lotus]